MTDKTLHIDKIGPHCGYLRDEKESTMNEDPGSEYLGGKGDNFLGTNFRSTK